MCLMGTLASQNGAFCSLPARAPPLEGSKRIQESPNDSEGLSDQEPKRVLKKPQVSLRLSYVPP